MAEDQRGKALQPQGVPFLRYADDIVVFADDAAGASLINHHLNSVKLILQAVTPASARITRRGAALSGAR